MDSKSLHQIHSAVFQKIGNQQEIEGLIHDLELVLVLVVKTVNPANPIYDKPVAD